MSRSEEIRDVKNSHESCCDRCFYCEAWLSSAHEHDHFPVPRCNGGKDVVPVCINCHDLKDRQALAYWFAGLAIPATMDLASAWPEFYLWHDAHPHWIAQALPEWQTVWPELSLPARLLYAKIIACDHQEQAYKREKLSKAATPSE